MNMNAAPGANIPNHLVWAIVSAVIALCLCCPGVATGIVAIVFATQVNTKLNQSDFDGARRASQTAKIWCIVTTVLAGIGLLINAIVMATGGNEQYLEMLQQMQQH